VYFIEFLKVAGRPGGDCPLVYASPTRRRFGTSSACGCCRGVVGHRRYPHITALRGDGVRPRLRGLERIVSEHLVRPALNRSGGIASPDVIPGGATSAAHTSVQDAGSQTPERTLLPT
jgi:hypothetical protein